MSTSDTGKRSTAARRGVIWYLCAAALCLIVHLVYSLFAHGLSSPFMTYLWAIPLSLGAGVCLLTGRLWRSFPGGPGFWLYNAGVATLTVGSLITGILEMADASTPLLWAYPIAGGVLLTAGILWYPLRRVAQVHKKGA